MNGQGVIKWEFHEKAEDAYSACSVATKDAKTGKVVTATATDPKVAATAAAPTLHYHYDSHAPQGVDDQITLF